MDGAGGSGRAGGWADEAWGSARRRAKAAASAQEHARGAHLELLAVAPLPVAGELSVDVPILGDVRLLVLGRQLVPRGAELLEAAQDGGRARRAAHVHVALHAQRAAEELRARRAGLGGEELV